MVIQVYVEEGLGYGKQSGVLQTGLSACVDDRLRILAKDKNVLQCLNSQYYGTWGNHGAMESNSETQESVGLLGMKSFLCLRFLTCMEQTSASMIFPKGRFK